LEEKEKSLMDNNQTINNTGEEKRLMISIFSYRNDLNEEAMIRQIILYKGVLINNNRRNKGVIRRIIDEEVK
jgi:hypothetical protein